MKRFDQLILRLFNQYNLDDVLVQICFLFSLHANNELYINFCGESIVIHHHYIISYNFIQGYPQTMRLLRDSIL